MAKVALVKSGNRFEAFRRKLKKHNCDTVIIDFNDFQWTEHSLADVDFLIFFPTFESSSNRPDSLSRVKHNIMHLHRMYPTLAMFPDPNVIPFYNDKYAQYLFLSSSGLPMPRTLAVDSEQSISSVSEIIGYPCVVKNRYGAGGDYVFKVEDENALRGLFDYSRLRFSSRKSIALLFSNFVSRKFCRAAFGSREAAYPFISFPLLAQKFIPHIKDLKIVVGDEAAVEGHWRKQANRHSWKMNIDGGGVGEWSFVPENVKSLSVKLAKSLNAKWLNVDFMFDNDTALISEFSPVWHHYALHEKADFVYGNDYNFPFSVDAAADLEEMIVSSYLRDARATNAH